MIKQPSPLKRGDTIAITCPAKYLPIDINEAVSLLEGWGLKVILGETVGAQFNQYAGTDELRTKDFQRFLDDKDVKAIIAARGGYGTIRIIDQLNFESFAINPKWIVGFSDITVLHAHIQACFGISTIHGQMPLTIPDSTKPALESLRKALFGEEITYEIPVSPFNRAGNAEGTLFGGNLALVVAMNRSVSEVDFTDKILFLEDVGEHYYSVDRMLWTLRRSGQLGKLRGLVVGGFTEMRDYDTPFGKCVEEIILEHTSDYLYPICFDFPAGHIDNNMSLIFGRSVSLTVEQTKVNLEYK